MAKIRLTKEFAFEMAHALEGYDGPCKNIHGHSYRFFVTVVGEPNKDICDPKYGMVMDFGDLKRIVNALIVDRYDHALVLRRSSSQYGVLYDAMKQQFPKIIFTEYQPTCENMIASFAKELSAALPQGIVLHHIKLYETATSYAQWYAVDNPTEEK